MTDQLLPTLLEESLTLNDSPDDTPPPSAAVLLDRPAHNVISHITEFPMELQVNILTYLRAYDLATVNLTCRYYHNPALVHAIVVFAAEGGVYPAELTEGFEQQPVMADASTVSTAATNNSKQHPKKGGKKKGAAAAPPPTVALTPHYTFEHLRNMELLVVARVLSRPEPFSEDDPANGSGGGYFVSKSWCKTALKWLEWQQERQQQYAAQQAAAAAAGGHKKQKKISKKQQRLRQRKYSDASPPWPNVNSDIVCCHQQLQRCSNRKSARARRKILDKQAWKCLKKFYPESVSLEAKEGECLQCIWEAETEKKTQQQLEEKRKEERKAPLSQPVIRRFYTRTRGVPVHCVTPLRQAEDDFCQELELQEDSKMPAKKLDIMKSPSTRGACPLVPGVYYAVPRAWCHAWRKYIKTGEGGPLLPPDASALLCDCHRLSLLPPHLEAYLYGESPQLWVSKKEQQQDDAAIVASELDESSSSLFGSPVARRSLVVGLSPEASFMLVPPELGLSPSELAQQQRAMMTLERQRELQVQREREAAAAAVLPSTEDRGEQLDRENYCCVEILAHEELEALEKLWPRQSVFRLSFEVLGNQDVSFSTQPCRECDASGMANFCKIPKTSKAHLRAAHQVKVRTYNNKTSNNSVNGGVKPGVQLEY